MDIYISFALLYYVYVIDFTSHVTLDIMIWKFSNRQGGMKKLWFKLHFNKKIKLLIYKK
jgi:hypothetical protein